MVKAAFSQLDPKVRLTIQVVLLLGVIVALVKGYKWLTEENVNAGYDPLGGEIPAGWSPTAINDTIADAFSGVSPFAGDKDNAIEPLKSLNNNQIIMIYNDWSQRYKGKSKGWFQGDWMTLTEEIRAESFIFGDDTQSVVLAILERLQLK